MNTFRTVPVTFFAVASQLEPILHANLTHNEMHTNIYPSPLVVLDPAVTQCHGMFIYVAIRRLKTILNKAYYTYFMYDAMENLHMKDLAIWHFMMLRLEKHESHYKIQLNKTNHSSYLSGPI